MKSILILATILAIQLTPILNGCCYTEENFDKKCENNDDCTGQRSCNQQGYCEGLSKCGSDSIPDKCEIDESKNKRGAGLCYSSDSCKGKRGCSGEGNCNG